MTFDDELNHYRDAAHNPSVTFNKHTLDVSVFLHIGSVSEYTNNYCPTRGQHAAQRTWSFLV